MITRNQQSAKKKQDGIALLVLVIVIALTLSAYYFSSISVVDIQLDRTLKTQVELKRAKQALLDYALINWRTAEEAGKIGKLPCPDYIAANNEGSQDGTCGNAYANAIGFFPWHALGIDIPKDSSGSCFIYVVSPAYKSSPVASLNPDSYGQIQIVDASGDVVQGTSPEDRPVAAIIAPGTALSGQARVYDEDSICGLDYGNILSYLDDDGTTDNAALAMATDDEIDVLVSSYAGSEDWDNPSPLNDRIITITHKEFWDVLESSITSTAFDTRMDNLTEAIALCLAAYGRNNDNHLPMPALLDLNGNKYDYRNDYDYDDSGDFTAGFSGRLPYIVSNANKELDPPTVSSPPFDGNHDELFKNVVCNDIDLQIGSYDEINFNDDSGTDQGEFFDLWRNWKDHFFYAISAHYKPGGAGSATPCGSDCIMVNGTKYAAIVFFSGLKRAGQHRYTRPFDAVLANKTVDPLNVDDKDDIANYLEGNNVVDFPDNTGNAVYDPVNGGTSNDIMFCITPAMDVKRC